MYDPWKTALENRRKARREMWVQKFKEKSGDADEMLVTPESLAEALAEEFANGADWHHELQSTMRKANRIQGRMN